MPRTTDDILKHADDLAKRFEEYEPQPGDERSPDAVRVLRESVLVRADAERRVQTAVDEARKSGLSWAAIGAVLGTTGEAARQRYRRAA